MAGKLMESLQTDLSTRIYRITNGFNEALYLVANEPSLGMYRLQEHIQATVPKVVEQRQVLQQTHLQVDGVCYDLGYDIETVQHMSKVNHFPSINAKLVQAVELKTLLDSIEKEAPGDTSNPSTITTLVTDHTPSTSINHEFKPKTFD